MSPKEVALAVDRSVDTVRRWIRGGQLKAKRDGISGEYTVAQAELLRFCKAHDVEVSNPFLQSVAT